MTPGIRQALSLGVVVLLVLGGVAVGASSTHARAQTTTDRTYVLEQGDRCRTVTPLSGEEPVDEFYEYGSFSSLGTTDLQRPNTSILLLYRGQAGTSLVMVHGTVDEGSQGGSVSMTVSGLPRSGTWVVEDDNYPGPTNYDRWNHTNGTSRIDWTWATANTDGAVFRGLEALNGSIEITPRFDEEAALYGEHYDGNVTAWQLLGGDRSSPDRVALEMDSPVTIRTGECPGAGDEDTRDGGSSPDGTDTGGDGEERDDGAPKDEDDGDDEDTEDDERGPPDRSEADDEVEDDGEAEDVDDGERAGYTICHRPPGNPDDAHTITVGSEAAVDAHLDHGDSRGACSESGERH